MKRTRFHRQATAELVGAAEYLREVAPAYAAEFLDEVERAVAQLEQFPRMGGKALGNHRRWLLRRFPYALIYLEHDGQLFVVAVAHTSRAPGYWTARDDEGDEVHEGARTTAGAARDSSRNPDEREKLLGYGG